MDQPFGLIGKAPVQFKNIKRQVPVALWLDTPTEWTLFSRKKRSHKCRAVMSLDEVVETRLAPAPSSSRRQFGKEESDTEAVANCVKDAEAKTCYSSPVKHLRAQMQRGTDPLNHLTTLCTLP